MTPSSLTSPVKGLLAKVPYLAAVYQLHLAGERAPHGGYRLDRLAQQLPLWRRAIEREGPLANPGGARRILLLGYLHWWIENTAALSLLLAHVGHEVTLAYLPFRHWCEPYAEFDVQRQRAYLRELLSELRPSVGPVDLLGLPTASMPAALETSLEEQSLLDVQYTLQREDIDPDSPGEGGRLYRLRLGRNRAAAARAFHLLQETDFDVAVLPNGSILEFGALHRVTRQLGLPTTTYDFGEQRNRLWLAQGEEVMRLNTDGLWQARGGLPLTANEKKELNQLYQARRGGQVWETFARQWQPGEGLGAHKVRAELGLDPNKKVVLLCTNVVGDSLALDRQVFTEGMAEWVERTVQHLAARKDTQLIVRVHPGELLGAGHPSVEIVRGALPELPSHVLVIPPDSEINTYDLIDLAHVGLVYTTTVGMEMAMSGVPVIVAGDAHYRDKGFTYHPSSLVEYFDRLDQLLADSKDAGQLPGQIDLAARYAYRFFFEYPFPYPWHVIGFWDDMAARSFEWVVREGGLGSYLVTLEALAGIPIDWSQRGSVIPAWEALA